jgi:hypothetical protein
MGLAGFSHDFGAVTGQRSLLSELFDAFASSPIDFVSAAVLMLSPSLPILASLPTERTKLRTRFSSQSVVIARELLMRATEVEGATKRDDKSILGLLSTTFIFDLPHIVDHSRSQGSDGGDGIPDVRRRSGFSGKR